jgi:hypothetical protein
MEARLAKTAGILLLCSSIDALARSFVFFGSIDLGQWAYALIMLLFVGDSVYYLLFAFLFSRTAVYYQRHSRPSWVYKLTSAGLALLLFVLFGSQRFYTVNQLWMMGIVYALIGWLYGGLWYEWLVGKLPKKEVID